MAHYSFTLHNFSRYPPPPSSFVPPRDLFPELYDDAPELNMDTSAQDLEGFGQGSYGCSAFEPWPEYVNQSPALLDFPATEAVPEETEPGEKVTEALPLSEIKTKEGDIFKELQIRNQVMKQGAKREMKEQKPHKRKLKKRKYLKRIGA